MLKVVVAGSTGRMGKVLLEAVDMAPDCVLHGAVVRQGSPAVGQMLMPGVLLMSDVGAALTGADVLIDFTRQPGAECHYHHLAPTGRPLPQ